MEILEKVLVRGEVGTSMGVLESNQIADRNSGSAEVEAEMVGCNNCSLP
jgi:hypothetical protein